MKKYGLAALGQKVGNISAGKIKDYNYPKQKLAQWNLDNQDSWMIKNVNIIDVSKGEVSKYRALLVEGNRIKRLLKEEECDTFEKKPLVKKIIDGRNGYLIPGLSDLHCHLSLLSEYKTALSDLYYFDAQRQLNCEFALQQGCTFVRDSAGAYDMVHGLIDLIENNELLGPTIHPSYQVMTPHGGMWDIGSMKNKAGEMIFGGKVVHVIKNKEDIDEHFELMRSFDSKSIKLYLEERPLYGGDENKDYNKFSQDMIDYIIEKAKKDKKVTESHAMFIDGARKAIKSGVTSIAHMTVDESYSEEDAYNMVKNNVSIVPTLGVGCYLAYNFKNAPSQQNEEYEFYREILKTHLRPIMEKEVLKELKHSYIGFYDFIWDEMEERHMPLIGKVYPERVHGFAKYAPESFRNFKKAGVKVGMGTDGGTGITFTGSFMVEFEGYKRYGMTEAEILRSATLTNMEILGLQNDRGSLDNGKIADMVLLNENPLESIYAIQKVSKVFKNGRLYVER